MTASRRISLTARALHIPFVVSFRHASAERRETSTVWVQATDGHVTGHGEGCPRPYVTGETAATALAFFESHAAIVADAIEDLASLRAWIRDHQSVIDANPAAWCAIELALLDVFARREGRTVDALLGMPSLAPSFRYTAVIGDGTAETVRRMAARYSALGFESFKLKLSGDDEHDRAKVVAVDRSTPVGMRLRVDANNVWPTREAAEAALRPFGPRFTGIEEPVAKGRYDELASLAHALGYPVILDESLTRADQIEALPQPTSACIANVRVSKMGGLLRSLDVVAACRARAVPVIVGAQVGETSVLTRAALTVATAAGVALIGHEGAFGTHLLERDVVSRPLMFGRGGWLARADYPELDGAGWGLDVASA